MCSSDFVKPLFTKSTGLISLAQFHVYDGVRCHFLLGQLAGRYCIQPKSRSSHTGPAEKTEMTVSNKRSIGAADASQSWLLPIFGL
jgi:hypothetical protein